MPTTNDTKTATKVYLFCNSHWGDNQGWIAIAETGVVICGHMSSSRGWGLHDVSPRMHQQDYIDALGADYKVELIEVPEGEGPPAEVLRLHEQLAVLEESSEVTR